MERPQSRVPTDSPSTGGWLGRIASTRDPPGGFPSRRESRRDPGGGLLIGRPFGVPIYVSPTWVIVAVLITVSFGPFVERRIPGLGGVAYVVALAFAVLLYLSVLVHELAHSGRRPALRAAGAPDLAVPARRRLRDRKGGADPRAGFLIAVAGPVLSLVLGGLGLAAAQPLEPGGVTVVHLLVLEVAGANLVVRHLQPRPGLPWTAVGWCKPECGRPPVGDCPALSSRPGRGARCPW